VLLRYIGRTTGADRLSFIMGDKQILRADFHQVDSGDPYVVINRFTGGDPKIIGRRIPRDD
jgi:hypothetical protein